MPANPSDAWGVKKLDGLVPTERPICYGVLKPGEYVPSGIALIRILDLEGDRVCDPRQLFRIGPALDAAFARSRLAGGEVLVSIQGTIGRIALAPASLSGANISRTIARVTIAKGYSARFVRHWLLSTRGQRALSDALVGTTRASLNIAELRAVEIPCPIEHEADHIADILDTVDDAIRQTERVIAKLEQVKAGMLQDLLTRGIDDNGEVRDPERYPEQFKDSPLGRIPKGWRSTTLGEVADYINGFAFKPHHWRESGLPIIRIAQMLDPLESVDRCPVAIPERHVVQDGELLFSWSATLAVVVWDRGPALVNQHIFRVVPRGGIRRNFLYHLLSASMDRLAAQSHGTTMKHVTRGDLLPFAVVIPPEDEQHRIAERLDQHEAQVRREGETLAKLRATKQALADDLLTGRIRVNPREAVPA